MDNEDEVDRDVKQKVCCICVKSSVDLVKKFHHQTLTKCHQNLKVRQTRGWKFSDISLPNSIDGDIGYHSQCYRAFNAISQKFDTGKPSTSANQSEAKLHLSNDSTTIDECEPPTSENVTEEEDEGETCSNLQQNASGQQDDSNKLVDEWENAIDLETNVDSIEDQACIFCDRNRKRKSGRICKLSCTTDLKSLQSALKLATMTDDVVFMKKVESLTCENTTYYYHQVCKANYISAGQIKVNKEENEQNPWHLKRKSYSTAYGNLCSFVQNNVIEQRQFYYVNFLQRLFRQFLQDEYTKNCIDFPNNFCTSDIEEKLVRQTFHKQLKVIISNSKRIMVPHDANLSDCNLEYTHEENIVNSAALVLRSRIVNITKKHFSKNVTVEELIDGECHVPPLVHNFFQILLSGGHNKRAQSAKCQTLSKSFAEDAIYGVTNARIKPSKHVTLGMALKSLTSSRKVVSIINSYGHCCSYNTVEEFETEVTFACAERNKICPSNITLSPNLNTGLAFDNFDRFVETLSGKDTLHDTVGIMYQDITVRENDNENVDVFLECAKGKRRRAFDAITPDIEPYGKRPRMSKTLRLLDHESRMVLPNNLKEIRQIDSMWMFSHACGLKTPMWVGFNSKIVKDTSKQQFVSYLTPMNSSPTDYGVVRATLTQSLQAAEECNDNYAVVTYDLAIAKIALQQQSMESPALDKVFISLGAFHIQMAYFKSIGKFIDGSGITNIMVECKMLANGSVASFLTGKCFNRCKRLHPLVTLVFEILHFKNFLTHSQINISEEAILYIALYGNTRSADLKIHNEEIVGIFAKYEEFRKQTLLGTHGETPKFIMTYVKLINDFHLFSRSIRTSDFELYKYMMPTLANSFFVFNQPNYARWLVRHHDDLIKIDETHPGLKENFERGGFGIKRTSKPFSRQPIDLTLEQTINADAARRLTGITCFTNSISARQRWSRSHGVRATIISHTLTETGLSQAEDVVGDLRECVIKKNITQIKDFMGAVESRLNPFSTHLDEHVLYNIATGRGAPQEVVNFLNSVEKSGSTLRDNFISECAEDESRFEKPIKRNKILSFVSCQKKLRIKLNNKVQEVKLQRDLFGRLLGISLEQNIDISKVLCYPLTPVPLALCHIDGIINYTNKSVLAKSLEQQVPNHTEPTNLDSIIVDGFFFMYLIKEAPKTMGQIALKILKMLCNLPAPRIDLIFDEYPELSIKNNEHVLRENISGVDFKIEGPDTERPANFTAELRNINFKQSLVEFLIQYWGIAVEAGKIIDKKTICINNGKCYQYTVSRGKVVKTDKPDYDCINHEEADTKIVNHVCTMPRENRILIRASDTDVMVIMLSNMQHATDKTIWMQLGVGNHVRNVNLSQIYQKLGERLCAALPGFHAYTGCDFNPAFYRKGKKRPFNMLKDDVKFQDAFTALSNRETLRDSEASKRMIDVLEEFTCRMYGLKNVDSVNEGRLAIFYKNFKAQANTEKFRKNVQSYDGCNLPPCKTELLEQINRTQYIAHIWRHAHLKTPTEMTPTSCGWVELEGRYSFKWFEGDEVPLLVKDIVITEDDDGNDLDVESSAEDPLEDGESDADIPLTDVDSEDDEN